MANERWHIFAGSRRLKIDGVEVSGMTAAIMNNLAGITATAAAINSVAGGSLAPINVPDATTYTFLAADSGKTHFIPDLTANCTFTLPAGAAGLKFRVKGSGVALDAQNWVFNSPAGVFFRGGVTHADLDAGAGADELVSVFPNGSSHITLTVTTPSPVTDIMFEWDGTRYVVNGVVHSNTAPAFS
jgi:hypothetical protein